MSSRGSTVPILVTGFEAFGGISENPSQRIVEWLAERGSVAGVPLVTEVLPTEYERAGRRVLELLAAHAPRAVLALGVAGGSTALRIEGIARNLDDHEAPDNAGERRTRRAIVPGGPSELPSRLPVATLHRRLRAAGHPVEISDDAGRYVCNHVFYRLCHGLPESDPEIPAGFVHVPDPSHPVCRAAGLDLEGICRAIELVLTTIVDPDLTPPPSPTAC